MKTLFVSIVLASITLFAFALSIAQSNPAPTPEMHMQHNMTMGASMNDENMEDMGQLMMRMGNILEKHQMTNGQHIKCARFINKLSKIMMICAVNVDFKSVDKHKDDLEELTKEWDYFERGNFEEH